MRKAPKSNNNKKLTKQRCCVLCCCYCVYLFAMVSGSCRRQLRALYSFAVTRAFLSLSLLVLA